MRKARAPLSIAVHLALSLLAAFSGAQDINRKEIESTKNKTIEFINYVGPHSVVDTKAQIRGIGEGIGSQIRSGAKQGGDLARYGVIHAVDPSVKTGFDADILYLGKGAGVDHIRNLRWIISGYLERAYGYSVKDADLLAYFITIYNAVYRGDTDYFASRYKTVVTGYLSKQNAGLSVRWDEWADRSRIVIPLGPDAAAGNISSVDTGKLTEEKVTEELRKTEDKGVAERKDLVELKEREVKEGEKELAETKEEIRKEDEALAAEREKLEEERKALEEKKAEDGVSAAVSEEGTDAEAEKAAREREEAALAEKEKALAEREKAADEKKAEAARAEGDIEEKKEEIETDRKKIAEDQQKQINEENGAAGKEEKPTATGTFVEALSLANPWARLLSLDLDSGKTVKKSELNTILVRSLVQADKSYYCIAGSTAGTGAVRLVSVNADSLAVDKEGKDDVFAGSFLVLKDGSLYAIAVKGGRFYLGRFGTDLTLKAQSAQPVHPYTALEFRTEGVVVQLADGGFAFLGKEDLKSIKVLK